MWQFWYHAHSYLAFYSLQLYFSMTGWVEMCIPVYAGDTGLGVYNLIHYTSQNVVNLIFFLSRS